MNKQKGFLENLEKSGGESFRTSEERRILNDKSMKAVRDRKQITEESHKIWRKPLRKWTQVFGYPNREYKDRVFRMLLKEPKVALEV